MEDIPDIELNFHFEVVEGTDLALTAQLIQERLSKLERVKEVEAIPEEPRLTGLEVVAAIAVTVLIIRGSREAVKELRNLLQEIQHLMECIKEVKATFLEIGEKRAQITNSVPSDEELHFLTGEPPVTGGDESTPR